MTHVTTRLNYVLKVMTLFYLFNSLTQLGVCMYVITKENDNLLNIDLLYFCISTPILKLQMTIFVIFNAN